MANLLIPRTELSDLPVIDLPEISSEEDKGPAEAQFQMEFPADDESTTRLVSQFHLNLVTLLYRLFDSGGLLTVHLN